MRALAVLIGVVVALLVGEGAVRLLHLFSPGVQRACKLKLSTAAGFDSINTISGLRRSVAVTPVPNRPWNGFVLNSKGLRTPEYTVARRPGTYRVVTLGDSFTFDSGEVPYPLHYTVLVRDGLRRRLGKPVELINLAIPGSGPLLQKRMLEIEGLRLKPDLILWTIFVGNDLVCEFEDFTTLGLSGQSWIIDVRDVVRWSYLGRVLRHVYYLQSVQYRDRNPPLEPPPGTRSGTYIDDPKAYDPDRPKAMLNPRMFLVLKRQNIKAFSRDDFPHQNWHAISIALSRAARLCREAGIPLLMVIIPDEVQVDRQLRRQVLYKLGRPEAAFEMTRPQKLLGELFRLEGVKYLDLLPAMLREGPRPRLYAPRDVHWNSRGNRVAAKEIIRRLEQLKLP